jgi:hypothetical protein
MKETTIVSVAVELGEEYLYFTSKSDFVTKMKGMADLLPESAQGIVLRIAYSGGMSDEMYYDYEKESNE